MKVSLLEAIADAIMHYEGWNAASRSYRNRNPGNLRATKHDQEQDAEGYRVFPCLEVGFSMLVHDLTCKVSGRNSHHLDRHSTLLDVFKVYAPEGDKNHPVAYAAFVANWLRVVYGVAEIYSTNTLEEIFQIVGQEVPDGVATAGNPGAVPGSVAKVPADGVDGGDGAAGADLPADPASVGGEPGS